MSRITEGFNFETSPYGQFLFVASTDGTTDPQQIVTGSRKVVHQNPTGSGFFVEPKQAHDNGRKNLDYYTRVVLMTQRFGGTGTWTAVLRLERDATDGVNFPAVTLSDAGAGGLVTVFDNAIPENFGKVTSSPTLGDNMELTYIVTPGSTDAVGVIFALFLVPSLRGSQQAGRGNIVSGRAWY